MADLKFIQTSVLEIAYEDEGPRDGGAVMLIHGWPDAPRGWNPVAQILHADGFRTIAPYLRGLPPTRFLSSDTPRFGAGVALAQDAIDLADALGLERFVVMGHDWGARAAYTMAALFPERISSLTALSLGYQPRGIFRVPEFEQSKRFWYQWLLCIDEGAEAVRRDPVGFGRIQSELEKPWAVAANSFSSNQPGGLHVSHWISLAGFVVFTPSVLFRRRLRIRFQ